MVLVVTKKKLLFEGQKFQIVVINCKLSRFSMVFKSKFDRFGTSIPVHPSLMGLKIDSHSKNQHDQIESVLTISKFKGFLNKYFSPDTE